MSRLANKTRKIEAEAAAPRAQRAAVAGAQRGAAPPPPVGFAGRALRVLCVDDHAVLVEGLQARFAIRGEIEVVGSLPTAERLVEEVTRLRPDVVVLDIEMPGPDAFEMTDRLKRRHPEVRVIVLSAHVRDAYIS